MATNSNSLDATQLLDKAALESLHKGSKKRKQSTSAKTPRKKAKSATLRNRLGGMIDGINALLTYSEDEARRFHGEQSVATTQEQPVEAETIQPVHQIQNEDPIEESNRFREVMRRIKKHGDYLPSTSHDQPYGTFMGRHIIGEHTKILGGIYLGIHAQEALVIDEKYGMLHEVYSELMLRYVRRHGVKHRETIEHKIIQELVDLTKEKICYGKDAYEEIAAKERFKPDQKVALDVFLEYGRGAERHQVLLAAYLLEKLKEKGLIKGKVYLDGHFSPDALNRERLIYSSASGYLFIFTPSAEADQTS